MPVLRTSIRTSLMPIPGTGTSSSHSPSFRSRFTRAGIFFDMDGCVITQPVRNFKMPEVSPPFAAGEAALLLVIRKCLLRQAQQPVVRRGYARQRRRRWAGHGGVSEHHLI